jgi:CheY-like chemotaxis protein
LVKLTGNETHLAYNGEEAVEEATKHRPDVILLDIGLPKLNGYDACRRIREKPWEKNVVIIALMGWGQEEDRQKSRDAGFDGQRISAMLSGGILRRMLSLRRAACSRPAGPLRSQGDELFCLFLRFSTVGSPQVRIGAGWPVSMRAVSRWSCRAASKCWLAFAGRQ